MGAGRPQPRQARGGPHTAGRHRHGLAKLDLLIADASDASALADVAAQTRVVITTVGPYLHHGGPLVAACAEAGTDYVDLTGEPEFVDRMYVAHHATAERTGARIVHACGFDSIPHDLGALFTVQQLAATGPVTMRGVVRASGMFSGGTFHSAMNAMSRARQMKEASSARRRAEGEPADGRSSRPVARQAAPRQEARAVAAADAADRPADRGPQRRGAGGVRAEVPLLPLRRPQDPALRRRWRRPASARSPSRAGQAAAQPAAREGQAGPGPDEAKREKSWFSVDFIGEGDGADDPHPRSPAATPATARPRRCWPSRRCASPSTTTPRRPARSPPPRRWATNLTARLQAAGIRFEVVA